MAQCEAASLPKRRATSAAARQSRPDSWILMPTTTATPTDDVSATPAGWLLIRNETPNDESPTEALAPFVRGAAQLDWRARSSPPGRFCGHALDAARAADRNRHGPATEADSIQTLWMNGIAQERNRRAAHECTAADHDHRVCPHQLLPVPLRVGRRRVAICDRSVGHGAAQCLGGPRRSDAARPGRSGGAWPGGAIC